MLIRKSKKAVPSCSPFPLKAWEEVLGAVGGVCSGVAPAPQGRSGSLARGSPGGGGGGSGQFATYGPGLGDLI